MKDVTKGLILGLIIGGALVAAALIVTPMLTQTEEAPEVQTYEISDFGYQTSFTVKSNYQLTGLQIFYGDENITEKASITYEDGTLTAKVTLPGEYELSKIKVSR